MTKFSSFQKGGTKDTPFHAGKPDDSYILDVLTATDKPRMPPPDVSDALPPTKIAVIQQWIKEGAKLDAGLDAKADLYHELRARWKPPVPALAYTFPVTVTSLAFTPDNKKLVVSGHHELTVWDTATAKLEKRIRTRERRALAMVFLPDGKLAVAGGRPGEEGDVRVYDINGGTPKVVNGVAYLDGVNDKGVMVKQLLEADDEVLCLALSPDGKKLASGGCDRVVNVWDISARRRQRQAGAVHRESRRLGVRRRLLAGRQISHNRQPRQDGQGMGSGDEGIGADVPGSPSGGLRRGDQGGRQGRLLGRRRQSDTRVERDRRQGRQADSRLGRPRQDDHQDDRGSQATIARDGQRRRHRAHLERENRRSGANAVGAHRLRLCRWRSARTAP